MYGKQTKESSDFRPGFMLIALNMSVQTTGKLNLRQIEKQKLEIDLIPAEQKWLQRAFENAAPPQELVGLSPEEWASKVEFEGHMIIESMKPDYIMRGNFAAKVPSVCSRCLEPFMADREGDFQIFIKRLEKGDSKEPSDDPDYWMMDTDELDLASIITEQIVVQEPIAESQHRNEEGELTCEGAEVLIVEETKAAPAVSPFAALAGLKLKSDKN